MSARLMHSASEAARVEPMPARNEKVNGAAMRITGPAWITLLLLSTILPAQDYSIDFHTIDGGGEILSESADQRWQLSGTLGQWDSTESLALSGGGYTLTGGFWPVNIDQTDRLFRDGFED